MKKFSITAASLAISALLASAAFAAGPTLVKQVEYAPVEIPAGTVQEIQPYAESEVIELYSDVTYRHTRRIAPCAIPYLVQVPVTTTCCDPCTCCVTCKTSCVTIKLCVPPCKTPCVKVRRDGEKYIYDFGKYEVKVTVRKSGRVIVNYRS